MTTTLELSDKSHELRWDFQTYCADVFIRRFFDLIPGPQSSLILLYIPVFRIRIRIHRIYMFFGLPDPDPLVRGMDPDPALDPDPDLIIMQK